MLSLGISKLKLQHVGSCVGNTILRY